MPDTRLIAKAPVTPYHIWLAVVAISGLSYLTYLVQRYRQVKGGALLRSLLGGAYSSTATTVVLAKQLREAATLHGPQLSAGIIAATAMMFPRLAAVVAFFNLAAALLSTLGFPVHRRGGARVVGVAENRTRLCRGPDDPCRQPCS